MTIDGAALGSFGDLGKAIGLLLPGGSPNGAWFENPVDGGSADTGYGLKSMLSDADQRQALLRFVDQVLGPPEARTHDGATWVPLFVNPDPTITIYAVVEAVPGPGPQEIRLGIGAEHTTQGDVPTVTTRVHVPMFRFEQRGTSLQGPADVLPEWLLIGRPGGEIEVEVDATLRSTPQAAGEASLGGVAASVVIPTHPSGEVGFGLTLRDLQLPGASSPRTFTMDAGSPEELGADVLDLVTGLVRAQAEALQDVPAFRPFAALAGVLGLRDVPGLPEFPVAELATQGIAAVVSWVEGVLEDGTARDAWLGEVADLVGGTLDAGRDAVRLEIAPLVLTIGVRVTPGAGGHPALVPWVEASLSTRGTAPVQAVARVDLLRADTGSGTVTAVPDVRLEAVFGAATTSGRLVGASAAADPKVDSIRVGIGLDADRMPTFVLIGQGVRIGGIERDVVDLSSPDAALATGTSILTQALSEALDALGPAAAPLVRRVLGIEPPAGVPAVSATALLTDPLGALRTYWAALVAAPAAMADVLGRLARLVAGETLAALPQAGTRADPWSVELVDPLFLQVWRDGTELRLDLALATTLPVFGELTSTTELKATVAVVDPANSRLALAQGARLASVLARADGQPARLGMSDLALVFESLAVGVVWSPTSGLRPELTATGLAIDAAASGPAADTLGRLPVPLPRIDGSGRLVFDAPDFEAVERALAVLVERLGVPEVSALTRLLGWSGAGARLSLSGLLAGDAVATIETWMADLLLDCDNVRTALGPVAALLSGFALAAPFGTGNSDDPFRCPVAGERRAPGLRVWLDPGCAVSRDALAVPLSGITGGEPPEPAAVAEALRAAALVAPDIADLMVGRDTLETGLQALLDRWAGTDGLVGQPGALPEGVTGVSLEGLGYESMVALGAVGQLAGQVVDPVPAAVVHVGCEESWLVGRPPGTAFDLTSTAPPPVLPDDAAGAWFVRVHTPSAAGAARPELGSVGAQAAAIVALLDGRSQPVALVGYGAAGAAVLRAANASTPVVEVVTVGAPWGPVATDSLVSGLGGDALRLLRLLTRGDAEAWPEELTAHEMSPLQLARDLVARSTRSLDPAGLPDVSVEPRRAGVAVSAVFGSLDPAELARGVGALVADGIQARLDARLSAATPSAVTALHAGLDVPVIDLDIGGLLAGVGVTFELCRVARPAAGPGIELDAVRGLVVDVHLGVTGGWLVGGPGSRGGAGDLRWMSARVDVPLDGREGTCELVLHEARGLGIDRERWVVRGDGLDPSATLALPEVRVLLSAVLDRVSAASAPLASLFDAFGLRAAGGLDPDGLDRLLHDTAATLRGRVAAAPATVAAAVRSLVPEATGTGPGVRWALGAASVSLDLATGTVTAQLATDLDGLMAVEIDVSAGPSGSTGSLAVGSVEENLGGVRLVVATPGTPGAPVTAAVRLGVPSRQVRDIALWPVPQVADLTEVAALCLPALGLKAVAEAALRAASETTRPLVLEAMEALGLLADAVNGVRRVRLPITAVADPAAWVAGVARSGATNPAGAAVALLDALAPLVVPGRGAEPGWPIAEGVVVEYAQVGDRLRLVLAVDIELELDATTMVTTSVEIGALVGPGSPPTPVVAASLDIDGRGIALSLDPDLRLGLVRPAPAAPLPIYPEGPGLGQTVGAVAESLVPLLLNELAGLGSGSAGLRRDVGLLVAELGDALALREGGQFTSGAIGVFAADPARALMTHLPDLVAGAADALATALDPSEVFVAVDTGPGQVTFRFGSADSVTLTLAGAPTPSVELTAQWEIPDVGTVAVEALRLSAAGVLVAARIGPVPVAAGPTILRPVLVVRAGSAAGAERLVGLGLALDDAALRTVETRWALDAQPPTLVGVTRNASGATTLVGEEDGPLWLISVAVSLVSGILVDALDDLLDARAQSVLEGVLFSTGTTVDPTLALDLLDPEKLLARLERLLWNAAQEGLAVTVAGAVTIGLTADGSDTDALLGINVTLADTFVLAEPGTKVELEVDETWLEPEVTGGLSVYAVRGTRAGEVFTFDFEPAVTVAGVGVRFTNPAGPLLELGPIALDGVAVHVYAEATTTDLGGGVQLELAGLAFAPSGGAGTNPVAGGIMSDAGAQASPANRPAFSPAVAVQKHPGDEDFRLSVRAGRPPGPWWVLVQRQLGPLYIERVGFDSAETGGRVSRITLLFDGRVEIFGLTAAVDQLSISWLGGDVLDITQWSVDLMGLAISADMSGVVLAGGLLKTDFEGNPAYVGMLLGRFGIYGLTVFGGYTSLDGDPSFFVFGAVNGPIGGPPAFFITGLGGGLGINRKLVVPDDPAGFGDYPFIMALDPYASVGDPMQRLRDLNTYFPPELGTFWFAGGISFTCFALVDGIAVLAVSFGNAGLDINLLGLARLALPNPAAPLVSIELGLLARFSTGEGLFMIRAALTDNSWLLYEDVRLTGGFAFCVWWKGPLAGQFVLTIGGYHPDFYREGYPDVPRLGLAWQVSNSISIKGGTFFALTSEALMAGLDVTAVADFGWAWAKVSFGAQALVYFDPFWLTADVWAYISAGVEIDTWFGTISFSITTGAEVHVQGPDFSGRARVKVGPCSVTVPFGSPQERKGQVQTWEQFVGKYLEDSGGGVARVLSGITGRGTLTPATGGDKSAPTPDGSGDRPFEVFAEFEITFTTTVPTSVFDIGGPATVPVAVTRSDGAAATLGLKPMNAGALASRLEVRLTRLNQATDVWEPVATDLAELAERSEVTSGSFPMGVWAAPDRSINESPALPTGDVINAGNQVRMVAEARQLNPGPTIDYYTVEAGRRPLPLQGTGTSRPSLIALANGLPTAAPATAAEAMTLAETRLFAAQPPVVEDVPLARGDRSGVARASYRGEVAAPPMFGKLTDGLAIANGESAAVAPQAPPPVVRPPALDAPRVIGYLAGGSRVAARTSGTTVSEEVVKRRPAPTLSSVHGRLGRRLPLSLGVAGLPGAQVSSTFAPPSMPFTAVPGAARSYGLGVGPASSRVAGLTGLGGTAPKGVRVSAKAGMTRLADSGVATLASGDVVVLHSPDHAADVSDRRPALELNGTGRLTALRGDGLVLLDTVATGAASIPKGAELVVLGADGSLQAEDGYAGWHTRSRIVGIGSASGIGAGCVLDLEGSITDVGVSWTTAGDLVRDAAAVTTSFSTQLTSLAIVVESDDPEHVGELGLELVGATRETDAAGNLVEATLLMNGTQAIAVYPVVPVPAGDRVAVRVVAGGGWRLTGVLGGNEPVETMAASLRRYGVAANTGRMLAVQGPGCRPVWQQATVQRGSGRGSR